MDLTPDELSRTKSFLNKVNEARRQKNAVDLTLQTAVKFMSARKFDIQRALVLYEAHEITRAREKLSHFDPSKPELRNELETGKFTVLNSRDENGSRIVIFSVCKHSPLEINHQVTLQGMVHQLDVAMEDFQTQRFGLIFVYNMIGSKYSNFDYELSQKILGLLKGAYPARLKKVLIVMAPLWFRAPFKILRLFVREKLRDRVFMVNLNQLLNHIPASSLPKELGGTYVHDHMAWLSECAKFTAQNEERGGLSDLAFITSGFTSTGNILSTHTSNQSLNTPGQGSSDDDTSSASSATAESATAVNNACESTLTATLNRKKPEKIIMPSFHPIENGSNASGGTRAVLIEEDKRPCLHTDTDPAMSLEEFINHMKVKGKKGLFEEYNEIKSLPLEGTFDYSRMRENAGKNRYTDVLCFDHSRVKLQQGDSDYINANFCDGYMQKRTFISTQGPLNQTFKDFWQMIWQESVVVIVMTTRTVERGRQKCGQYWPLEENDSMEFSNFKLTTNSVETFSDYIISHLTLTNTTNNSTRQVCHMLFVSWPDYGVPHSSVAMLEFREKVREQQKKLTQGLTTWTGHEGGPPIVIHCSAGIGRTGTFMTLDISLMRLIDTNKIDIRRTVEKIRTQRAHSIQMPDQYVFCYLALLEFALTRRLLEDVDLAGFDDSDSDIEEE